MQNSNRSSIAFIFPGQGSQSVGMMSDFVEQHSIVKQTFEEASSALGYDLLAVSLDGPEEELNRTEITQPALLTAGVACWRLWEELKGPEPKFMAGHSLGEYTALACSGVIDFDVAVTLVRDRGVYMQSAVAEGEGTMAAIIGMSKEDIISVCDSSSSYGTVSAANFNSPEQTVIAGSTSGVNHAVELAKERGAKRSVILPVSVPSHCELMTTAAQRLAERLDEITFNDARIPVMQNVDARAHVNAGEIKQSLVEQLHQPVLWVDTVNSLLEQGCNVLVESAPGRVLSGLVKRINREVSMLNLSTPESLQSTLETIKI